MNSRIAIPIALALFFPLHLLHASAPRPVIEISRSATPIRIDGRLDEEAWRHAAMIRLDYEYMPGENIAPPVETECRVTYDSEFLYLGCVAHDPEPERIRASLTDRDKALQDDHIVLILDTFNDQRRAFQFRINPLGVQMDATFAQTSEDFSWDAIWSSAGRVTEEGYVVEAAIPFRSLRFPRSDQPQSWGVILERSWPRNVRHRIRSSPLDRNNSCILCQGSVLRGLEGITPGRDVEINPTATAGRHDSRSPDGGFNTGETDSRAGMNFRWGVTPNLSLNGTINPDFSQVEADAAQLSVNERFAVFYPEKRPFFLEGADLFESFFNVVFTRTIIDPEAGVKLTGKEGRHGFGAFATRDRLTSLLFPSNQRSRSAMLDQEVTTGVVRYRYDLGASSNLGVLHTHRSGAGYQNDVSAVDAFVRVSPSNTVRAQYLRSTTEYPEAIASAFNQPEDRFSDDVLAVAFIHSSRNWQATASYQDMGRDFRADAGFVRRVDAEVARGSLQRVFWGGPKSWFNRLAFGAQGEHLVTQDGVMSDRGGVAWLNIQAARQSAMNWTISQNRTLYGGEYFDLVDSRIQYSIRPTRDMTLRLDGQLGDAIDFANVRKAKIMQLGPAIDYRFGRHLNIDLAHTLQRLDTLEGEQIFDASVSQLRAVYNFSTRMLVRGLVQYHDTRRNPEVFRRTVTREERQLASQLLFSYKLNPQTVLFLGYSDLHRGDQQIDLLQESRSYFMKIGYALRL
jgi:hypothetical protein